MNRYYLSLLVPPLAVCRYGCAGCCAAPIAVFWLTGIGGIIYGFFGGPLGLESISWNTVGLGVLLWVIASVWATITVHNVNEELCRQRKRTICTQLGLREDEADPLDEVRKAR